MKKNLILLIFSLGGTLFIDQASKSLAKDTVVNTGISFGLFSGSLLTLLLIAILAFIAVQFGKGFFKISPLATGAFFGGSVSNIIDRTVFGGVRDFLPVPLLHVRNNIADWVIFLSLAWLFWRSTYNTRR